MKRWPILVAVPLACVLAAPALPGKAEAQASCPRIADDELFVPGGRVKIGTDAAYAEEAPPYETELKGFWIDRHEVTNRQFAAFVAATGHRTAAEAEGGSVVFIPPAADALPVHPSHWWHYVAGADWRHPGGPGTDLQGKAELPAVHIAYADALAYARWAGRTLPTEEQFEHAARAGAVASDGQPAADEANTWQGRFPGGNDAEDGYRGLAPAGCLKPNRLGLNDMIGNAWEWTSTWYLPTHAALPDVGAVPGNPSFDPAQPDARTRVIKGGSFLCAPNYCARYRPEARHAQDELAGASHLGFRTVRTAGGRVR